MCFTLTVRSTAGDEGGSGGWDEVSPFATLLRKHYGKKSFHLDIEPTTQLDAYPPPVVVEGLPAGLTLLCGMYEYSGMHEGKPYFTCTLSVLCLPVVCSCGCCPMYLQLWIEDANLSRDSYRQCGRCMAGSKGQQANVQCINV